MFEHSFLPLHAPLCGIFALNSGYVASCVPFTRDKYFANNDVHLSDRILKHALK
ncbi:DUF6783 domain-containing protein [uncultured Robinsoniella sp.]|uniref:DUF6783 domain-containing protein n=1 Tax=uncultured Robinsoniella sp. TaxID=904190 RepID=UPI00374F342B